MDPLPHDSPRSSQVEPLACCCNALRLIGGTTRSGFPKEWDGRCRCFTFDCCGRLCVSTIALCNQRFTASPKDRQIASTSRTPSARRRLYGLSPCPSAEPVAADSEEDGESSLLLMSHSEIGPPIIPPATRPKVAKAIPTSSAFSNPAAVASCPHAMAVPCPPANDTLPAKSPYPGWAPNALASKTPVAF